MLYLKGPTGLKLLHVTLQRIDGKVRCLDVGCGTGWWAQRLAGFNPAYEVTGFDIVGHQPSLGPGREPNADFIAPVDFMSDNWGVGTFPVVHAGLMCGSVPDWLKFYQNVFRHVTSGGQAEFVEIDWQPRCDVPNPSVQDRAAFREWWTNMLEATRQQGKPIEYRQDTGALLTQAGFTGIQHEESRIQTVAPWQDHAARDVAEAFQVAMGDAASRPWSGFSMELFTRFRGYTPADVDYLDSRLVEAVNRSGSPFYFVKHVWTARKPATQRPLTQVRPFV
ncbi:hypothetical protein LTR85_005546 [Meristemomyces frigidus]|nr:hypothetical protein LTR85_005546 [Meristemomyces frigidus]